MSRFEPIYIDESINILTGEAARSALDAKNDLPFFSADKGVVKVDASRWGEAQEAAKSHWMRRGLKALSDHNEENTRELEGFAALCGRRFSRSLEIGCGPFSNARFIGRVCDLGRLDLLDPLIETYFSHPFCRFNGGKLILDGTYGNRIGGLAWKVLARTSPAAFLAMKRMLNPTLTVDKLLPCSAEEMPTGNGYDLVAILNVIEHCYDVERIFANILSGSARKSVIIFQDELYDADQVQDSLATSFDAAHPIKASEGLIEGFLFGNYRPLLCRKRIYQYRTSRGNMVEKKAISFIGERK